MTDNEIIKALACCDNDKQCTECPMKDSYPFCDDIIGGIALDLINRLQAENKRLSTLAELGNKRADDYRVMRDRALKAEKEVERLKDILLAFMQALGKVRNVDDIESILQIPIMWELNKQFRAEIKAEAYKEFAERLKRRFLNKNEVINNTIDNLLKELVGEDNG